MCGFVCEDRNGLRHDGSQNEGMTSSEQLFNVMGLPKTYERLLKRRRKESSALRQLIFKSAKVIAGHLSFSKDMKLQLDSLITSALKAHRWVRGGARALAGVCSFIIMTQTGIPVTVTTVTALMDEDAAEKFPLTYYQLLKFLPSINPGVHRFGGEFEVVMSGFKIAEGEKKPLFGRVKRVIEMIGEVKCLDSILSVNFVIAATFVCWKSLQKSYSKYKFTSFCHLHEVDPSKLSIRTIAIRIKQITDFFLLWSRQIHYLKNLKINHKNVFKFIDDILRYQSTIVHDVKREKEEAWRRREKEEEWREREKEAWREREMDEQQPKRVKLDQHVPIQEDISESEFSDTEINSYIRTPEEVEMSRLLKSSQSTDEEEEKD